MSRVDLKSSKNFFGRSLFDVADRSPPGMVQFGSSSGNTTGSRQQIIPTGSASEGSGCARLRVGLVCQKCYPLLNHARSTTHGLRRFAICAVGGYQAVESRPTSASSCRAAGSSGANRSACSQAPTASSMRPLSLRAQPRFKYVPG